MFEDMRDRMKSSAVLLFAVGVASLLFACSSEEEPAKPQPPAPTPPTRQAQPPVKRPVPTTVMEQLEVEVEVPDYYPKDAPVYPGSKASRAEWQMGRVTAVFSTPDPIADVVIYMSDFLSAQGWQDVQHLEMDDGSLVEGDKTTDDRSISVFLTWVDEEAGSATMIVVATDP
jgi:hypothetical protein